MTKKFIGFFSVKERPILAAILSPVLAVLVAFGIGAILITIAGANPLVAYQALFVGAFGSLHGFGETLAKTTPLLIIGLGLAVAFKSRMFNIGAPGQLYMGALAATVVGLTFTGLPAVLLIPLMMATGFLGGAAFGAIPALLKVKFEVHEIICTVLLNYIALFFVNYLVEGPMKEPGAYVAATSMLPSSAWLPRLIPGTRFHAGFLIALLCIPLVYLILEKSTLGYRIKAVGASLKSARYGGISVSKYMILAMVISGGLAGLAGTIELSAVFYRLEEGFTFEVGFTAIIIAWLGRCHPIGVGLTALLFGALINGGQAMHRVTGVPVGLIYAFQGIVLILVLASEYLVRRKG